MESEEQSNEENETIYEIECTENNGDNKVDEKKEMEEMNFIAKQVVQNGYQRFNLKKWVAAACWGWEVEVGNCAICRNHMMEMCIECQSKQSNGIECTVAWGFCNHSFHLHCISRWIQTRSVCPLDNQEWNFMKFGN